VSAVGSSEGGGHLHSGAEPQPILIVEVPAGTCWYRIHHAGDDPLWFRPSPGDPPAFRFDDPESEYRVCYVGASPEASFAEVMLRRAPVRVVARSELASRILTCVHVARDLRLASLTGAGLARAGITAAVTTGLDYALSRDAGRRIWLHPARVDGILYDCRHDTDQCAIALFDRAQSPGPAVTIAESRPLDADPRQILDWSRRYRFGLI
jgi:hypothetical protein